MEFKELKRVRTLICASTCRRYPKYYMAMTCHLFCRGRGFCVVAEECYGVIKTKHSFLLIMHKNKAELQMPAPHNWHVCLVLDVCFLKCESAIYHPYRLWSWCCVWPFYCWNGLIHAQSYDWSC